MDLALKLHFHQFQTTFDRIKAKKQIIFHKVHNSCTFLSVVKCPTIATPPHGVVSPPPCNSISDVNYGTNCIFSCNASAGYQLEGPSNVSCLDSGLWSADTTKIICKGIKCKFICVHSLLETKKLIRCLFILLSFSCFFRSSMCIAPPRSLTNLLCFD